MREFFLSIKKRAKKYVGALGGYLVGHPDLPDGYDGVYLGEYYRRVKNRVPDKDFIDIDGKKHYCFDPDYEFEGFTEYFFIVRSIREKIGEIELNRFFGAQHESEEFFRYIVSLFSKTYSINFEETGDFDIENRYCSATRGDATIGICKFKITDGYMVKLTIKDKKWSGDNKKTSGVIPLFNNNAAKYE